jgi:23S rRNA pseudouridine2605 synthase
MTSSPHKRVTLDRLFSKLGLASRGTARAWIAAGRVRVNRQVICNPDTWLSWPEDVVLLDERALAAPTRRFMMFHKPKGYITTHSDERGRKTIFDLLPKDVGFLHAVGRLDQATSGLLLLTNDNRLSSFLTDPAQSVPRIYLVTVRGEFTSMIAEQACKGVLEADELLRCASVTVRKSSSRESHLTMTLTAGKNREIRRLCLALGHEVSRLRRIQYGPFELGDLAPGAWREIPIEEAVAALRLAGHTYE